MPGIDSYTKLMLHLNGADGSTTITDDSGNSRNGTCVGTAQIDTAQSEFGGASLLCDGDSDWVQVADNADWAWSTGDYTIDFWFKWNAPGVGGGFIGQHVDANNRWGILKTAAGGVTFEWMISGTQYYIYQTGLIADTNWHHLALVRSGTSGLLFYDGANTNANSNVSSTDFPDIASVLTIGNVQEGTNNYLLNGWMDEIRVSKGIARWTDTFTPPTAEYSTGAATGAVGQLTTNSGYWGGISV